MKNILLVLSVIFSAVMYPVTSSSQTVFVVHEKVYDGIKCVCENSGFYGVTMEPEAPIVGIVPSSEYSYFMMYLGNRLVVVYKKFNDNFGGGEDFNINVLEGATVAVVNKISLYDKRRRLIVEENKTGTVQSGSVELKTDENGQKILQFKDFKIDNMDFEEIIFGDNK